MTHMHYLILAFNIIPALLAIVTMFSIKGCDNAPHLKECLFALLAAVAFKSMWFVGLQIDWVVNNYDDTVGQASSFAWMMFDYWNAFINLVFVVSVRVYLKWRKDCYKNCIKVERGSN